MRLLGRAIPTSLALILATACGADAGDGDGDSYSLTWGPVEVPAGTEATQCVIVELDNPEAVKVTRFHNQLGATSHHFIVYEVPADTELRPEPYDCQPFADILDGAPLIVTQKADDILELPAGVAYSLEARQRIRLEMHYINASDESQALTATASFDTADPETIEHEADFLFVGDVDIDIPPQSTMTVGKTFVDMPGSMSGVNYFAITGHTHQYGTNVTVATAPSAGGQETMVYDLANFNWSEPDTVTHTPPFTVPDGGGFSFSCEYNNTSDQQVGFGESANDEMCFFWAYYYPSSGARVCAQTDSFGAACCPDVALACQFLDSL